VARAIRAAICADHNLKVVSQILSTIKILHFLSVICVRIVRFQVLNPRIEIFATVWLCRHHLAEQFRRLPLPAGFYSVLWVSVLENPQICDGAIVISDGAIGRGRDAAIPSAPLSID
jgi:hypothetical protein